MTWPARMCTQIETSIEARPIKASIGHSNWIGNDQVRRISGSRQQCRNTMRCVPPSCRTSSLFTYSATLMQASWFRPELRSTPLPPNWAMLIRQQFFAPMATWPLKSESVRCGSDLHRSAPRTTRRLEGDLTNCETGEPACTAEFGESMPRFRTSGIPLVPLSRPDYRAQ